jgi:hypothetical protein
MADAELKEKKKELAKKKRQAVELASQVHDIVEDTLWTDYDKLLGLSEQIKVAVEEANSFKAANGL